MNVITRFAPAPTGNLHMGGARTALFNYLFAKASGGRFLLRIDDTDIARSSDLYVQNIKNSLKWLNIRWDNEGHELYQSSRIKLYTKLANDLVDQGKAYRCHATEDEDVEIKKIENVNERKLALRSISEDNSKPYTIRFKMPLEGKFKVTDTVAGTVEIECENLDDFILIRQDGNPTYMLASVVDDAEMSITHIIRGKEHLTNTYRQIPLMNAFGYTIPSYSHVPIINDATGKKLSKREGAQSIQEYEAMGILPEAICSYMLRLGWGQGNVDIVPMDQAKTIFNLEGLRPSPARFDMDKILSINSHYIKTISDDDLISRLDIKKDIIPQVRMCLSNLREKADNLIYINDMSNKIFASKVVTLFDDLPNLDENEMNFINTIDWKKVDFSSSSSINESLKSMLSNHPNINKRNIFMYLRIALTGLKVSPGLFEVMHALGKDVCVERIMRAVSG
jgi:glutamyl-tRNA synthetase